MWNFKKNIYQTRREDCINCSLPDETIGTQTWTSCNATTEFYRDGSPIPYVPIANNWSNITYGAWCYVNNDPSTECIYGKLYNGYAINDPRGFAPTGYHVPSESEWIILSNSLGGAAVAGGPMKESGFSHWNTPNLGATNSSKFTGLPAGWRDYGVPDFERIGDQGFWWSTTVLPQGGLRCVTLSKANTELHIDSAHYRYGFSVRFIKDAVAPCVDCISHDVNINGQIWSGCNLDVTTYSDGITIIPEVTTFADWYQLTTGAWCWYANDSANGPIYGKLYNWYAVAGVYDAASLANPALRKQLAPVGYHIPTDTEWTTLTNYLGGDSVANPKLREVGTCHWFTPNTGATDEVGFTALPGGYRWYDNNNNFVNKTVDAGFWTLTEYDLNFAWYRTLNVTTNYVQRFRYLKQNGFSVRVVKD